MLYCQACGLPAGYHPGQCRIAADFPNWWGVERATGKVDESGPEVYIKHLTASPHCKALQPISTAKLLACPCGWSVAQ